MPTELTSFNALLNVVTLFATALVLAQHQKLQRKVDDVGRDTSVTKGETTEIKSRVNGPLDSIRRAIRQVKRRLKRLEERDGPPPPRARK